MKPTPDPAKRSRLIAALAWTHPLLLALYPALTLFQANRAELDSGQLVRAAPALLVGTAALLAIVNRLLRQDLRNAALAVSGFVFLLFLYRSIEDVPASLSLLLLPDQARAWMVAVPLWLLLTVGVVWGALRLRRSLDEATQGAAFIAAVLCVQPLWLLATSYHGIESDLGTGAAEAAPRKSLPPDSSGGRVTTPDLFYIVLDAYGRDDVLSHFYRFDNGPFLDGLRERGFTVARHSGANYLQTVLALSAALNLQYVQDLLRAHPELQQKDGVMALAPVLDDNAVSQLMRQRGYRTIAIPSGAGLIPTTTADMTLEPPSLTTAQSSLRPLDGLLIERTPLNRLPRSNTQPFDEHRTRLDYAFEALDEAARLPHPKFVFAHILAPHPPFVYGPNGEAVQPPGGVFTITDASGLRRKMSAEQYRSLYIGQLQWLNQRVLAALDAIQRDDRRPAIIVVQGDHGPRMLLDWYSKEKTELNEPIRNLTAIRLPDHQPGDTETIDRLTPVNTFRFLLRTRYGADLPPLPDRTYCSLLLKPFEFTSAPDPRPRLSNP